jgi:O-antigen/teichoic acid export membrane protein
MTAIRSALFYSAIEKYVGYIVGVASTLVLARLLTPSEIGVFSIGYSVVGLAHMLRELGVGEYVIQERELTRDRLRSALFVSLLMAWLAGAALVAASGPIAAFYREPELERIIWVLAANFVFIPIGAVTLAVLRRHLRMKAVMIIGLAGSVGSAVVTVGLALAGNGAMSMAWGSLFGVGVVSIVAVVFRPRELPWMPGTTEVSRVLKVGGRLTIAQFAERISSSAPDLVIGKTLGVHAAGIFSKAVGLVDIFARTLLQVVWSVALPHFASQVREGREFQSDYLRSSNLLSGAAWPFFAALAVGADPTVRLLLGPQWTESAPLVGVLCIAGTISTPFAAFGHLYLAKCGAGGFARYQLVTAALKVLTLLATAPFGLAVIAWGQVVVAVCLASWTLHLQARRLQISAKAFLYACMPSAALAMAAGLGAFTASRALVGGSLGVEFAVTYAAAAGAAAAAAWLVKHGLLDEMKRALRTR